jgi:hypothetical protein
MNQSFKTLWNITFVVTGILWASLVLMIWTSGQLKTPQDQIIFLCVVIPAFVLIYLSGFLIAKRHTKKLESAS